MSALILLHQIAHHATIDVLCSRCDRRGRQSIARLIRDHGPDAEVGIEWPTLNAGCPKLHALGAGKKCDLYAPQLGEMVYGVGWQGW